MKKIKTAQEIKESVKENDVNRWNIGSCSFCNYTLAYLFKDNEVKFDAGCHCSKRPPQIEDRRWRDVAKHYNMNHPTNNEDMPQEQFDEGFNKPLGFTE